MKLADALVRVLRDLGLRYLFGVSGANVEHLHDAVHRLGGNDFISILAKTEIGAAFMADCRARVHKSLGVCCATSGGGMLNLAVGIAESYSEGIPVLALVGQPPLNLEGRGAFQDSSGRGDMVDSVLLWRSISKYVGKITEAADFWPMLRAALVSALSGRRGPAVLLLPRDVYEYEVGEPPDDWPTALASFARTQVVSESELAALLALIRSARRPVFIVGAGVGHSPGTAAALRALAGKLRVPVVTTMSSRGEFSDDDPLYLGMIGAAGHPSAQSYLRDQADVIIALGTTLDVMTRTPIEHSFRFKRFAVIDVEVDAVQRVVKAEVALQADLGDALRALLRLEERDPIPAFPPVVGYQRHYYAPRAAPELPGEQPPAESDTLLQSEALSALAGYLTESGHLVFDAGNCAAAGLHYVTLPKGSSSTIALGMGGMGYAIAGAIGAQLGSKAGTRTTVICGDGAFLMLGLEVHTAVELGLPILFVVFNNGMHGMCATRQQLLFDSRIEAVRYHAVDFSSIARGLGPAEKLWCGVASTKRELHQRLREYSEGSPRLPGVLDLRLLREEVPPFAPFLGSDAPTLPSTAFASG